MPYSVHRPANNHEVPVHNLHNGICPTGHVPWEQVRIGKLPMHKGSIQSCLSTHMHTHPWVQTVLVVCLTLCTKPTLYLRPFAVDLSSWAKYGRPYWAWSAPSITVLIASVDAAACALLKWYMPRSSLTYNYKHHHTHARCNRWGQSTQSTREHGQTTGNSHIACGWTLLAATFSSPHHCWLGASDHRSLCTCRTRQTCNIKVQAQE